MLLIILFIMHVAQPLGFELQGLLAGASMFVRVGEWCHRSTTSLVLQRNAEALLASIEDSKELLEDDVTHDLDLARSLLHTRHALTNLLRVLHVGTLDSGHVTTDVDTEVGKRLTAVVEPRIVQLVILDCLDLLVVGFDERAIKVDERGTGVCDDWAAVAAFVDLLSKAMSVPLPKRLR